jgi:hypothetical protein
VDFFFDVLDELLVLLVLLVELVLFEAKLYALIWL